MPNLCPFQDCSGHIFVRRLVDVTMFGCDVGNHGDSAIRHKMAEEIEFATAEDAHSMDEILRRCDPVEWLKEKVLEAKIVPSEKFQLERLDVHVPNLPSYPTGFAGTERGVLLELRGMTTLSGKASSGKSWFALGSSLTAANEGWDVHYLPAEARDVIHRRIIGAYGMTPPPRFKLHKLNPGITVDYIIDEIAGWITSERTLIVIDSISTLMELMSFAPGSNKWEDQARFEMFLLRLRELTLGGVSILNLSESNVAGESKGRTLDHRSDVSINFVSIEDADTKTVRVVKAWEGPIGVVGNARVKPEWPGLELIYDYDGPISDEPSTGGF